MWTYPLKHVIPLYFVYKNLGTLSLLKTYFKLTSVVVLILCVWLYSYVGIEVRG